MPTQPRREVSERGVRGSDNPQVRASNMGGNDEKSTLIALGIYSSKYLADRA